MVLYLDKRGKVTDVEGDGIWICSSCIDSGFMQDMAAPLPQGRQRHGGGGVYLSDLTNKERAAIVATQGLRDLEAAGRDARDWLVEAMNRRSNGGEVLALAHGRLEAMNLGDGDPDAEARAHAYPDDSAGADDGRVAALERAIVEAVGLLACHDLHGDETALAARQAFEGLGIPGLVMVTRCAICAEPIEGEAETCPDCGVSLFNNVVTGLEALGHEEGDGDA